MKNEAVISGLVENLKPADPYKIILFGSCARDEMTADSDIDLMVVLDNDDVAKTYEERAKKEIGRMQTGTRYKLQNGSGYFGIFQKRTKYFKGLRQFFY